MSEWRTLQADRGDHGVRVDLVLLRHLREEKGVSRNRIQQWIDAGDVLVNGASAKRASWRIQAGDDLQVRLTRIAVRERPKAEKIPLDILYEDDDLLALNKPAGLVVHPSYKHATGTLMNGLLDYATRWPSGSAPALIGRLDKLTSGLVLVSKRREIQAALQRAAAARRVDKDYVAIVRGKPSPIRGTIDLALDRDPWDRRRITVTDRGGQPSVTMYERLTTANGFSIVRCRLITGRTHQLRVHLSAKGWPIVGDATYGSSVAANVEDMERQALHSWRISLKQPHAGRDLQIEAPVPADMRAFAAKVGLAL